MVMFPWNIAMATDPNHADDFSAQLLYSVDEGRSVHTYQLFQPDDYKFVREKLFFLLFFLGGRGLKLEPVMGVLQHMS